MQTGKANRKLGLWRMADHPIHFLGSIHLLGEFAYPLPGEMEENYKKSTTLVIEADAARPAPSSIHLYEDGRTLETVLPPRLYGQTCDVLAKCSSSITNFRNTKPWHLALTIIGCFYRTHGCTAEWGIDSYFKRRANADNKLIVELESLEQQLKLFDSLSLENQLKFLQNAVEDPHRTLRDAQKMIEGWISWDEQKLSSVIDDAESRFPGLRTFMVTGRNKQWIAKIEEIANQNQPTLIVVGALHLLGEDSVISLLRAKGHRLLQVSTNC